ncbi:UNVERIFIED_ORG: AcrR family transcriptional regulator [Bradyrhizobium japonicum]|uniref:Transcriptional regulatory protein n=2 Tax=Bradyrhizobium diazoefficiens TaxID=1355477 RepID=A0A0E4BNM3_9BRAD|nr:putative transcriptional regulatory protein [Bradyrhizobium diazoefficiens SEMIA 5080]MBP1096626.1 AcrR family transcriptional regulator [Bradyrhizobium japonicum]BAR56298.1 transcriptional regulatory protein [Bradyrhizobium diazoefficiens]
MSSGEKSPAAPGLRERKQQQTRERLKRAAMALFLERGFETTTIDDIAAAADVSRRSFFHYFASKEDVVAAWQEDAAAALVSEILARPADESMLTAAENAIAAAVKRIDPTEAAAMSRLKRDNPALHARDQLKYEKLERALADGLTQRSGRKSDRLKARLVAMIATGAMRVGGESWIGEGAREKPEAFVKRTFDAIRAILK